MASSWPEEVSERLTLKEKVSLLTGKSMWTLRSMETKRGVVIPPVRVSDGPQGVRRALSDWTAMQSNPATCFPAACALACSWDRDLVQRIGVALSEECEEQEVQILLGPGMNVKRHPCGGRNFEYFSEDPVLSGRMSASMVTGIQRKGRVGACIKHFCVNNQESWRFRINALVDERTLREVYLRGFEYCIRHARPWTIMCAYNQLNGKYCSENEWLFRKVIREDWGYEGHVLTDWGATNRRAVGVQAGVDLEMPGTCGIHNKLLEAALKDGSLTRDKVDNAVHNNLRLIRRASTTNGTKKIVDCNGSAGEYSTQMPSSRGVEGEGIYQLHHGLAYQAALECIVLLQNEGNVLPLISKQEQCSKQPSRVTLVGDFCQNPRFQGMGSSKVKCTKVDTVLEHISKHTDQYIFSPGYCNTDDDKNEREKQKGTFPKTDKEKNGYELIEKAVDDCRDSEAVIIMAGVPEIFESEGFDREHLNLPTGQNELIHRICQVNSNVIVVLNNGGPVVMPWRHKVKAIVECYLLGQAGAKALLDILFGVASPSGKLAETFPLARTDVPSDRYFPGDSFTVEYREGLNVGYRYYDTIEMPILFPFGHGLSYTLFSYTNCSCKVIKGSGTKSTPLVKVQCTITNEGKQPGAEVVQIYVHHHESCTGVYHPEHQLEEFKKTKVLKPRESEAVELCLTADAFAFFDIGVSAWILEEGAKYEIRIAASSRDIRWTGTIDNDAIVRSGNSKHMVAKPSDDARGTHPRVPRTKGKTLPSPMIVSDDAFQAMLRQHPRELMYLSSRTLLQVSNPNLRVLPSDIDYIHKNSLLSEIEQNGRFGSLFTKVLMKASERAEMEDPTNIRERKMIREIARNLPLRCISTFSRGYISFDLLDCLISFFNGHYLRGITQMASCFYKAAFGLLRGLIEVFR